MSWLRTLMLLALIVWIGGIIFFAFVLAPTVFTVLPTTRLAGDVVNATLSRLHWIGLACGAVFLLCSLLNNRQKHARMKPFSAPHVLVALMLALTAVSQFGITPRMRALRIEMGVVQGASPVDASRAEFDRLHAWSTRAEGSVLFLGLAVVVLTARRFS